MSGNLSYTVIEPWAAGEDPERLVIEMGGQQYIVRWVSVEGTIKGRRLTAYTVDNEEVASAMGNYSLFKKLRKLVKAKG